MLNRYSKNVFKSEWMELVHTLNECGMTDVGLHQGTKINILFKTKLTEILKPQFQHWGSEMANSSKCALYNTNLDFEDYRVTLNKCNHKISIKIRTRNYKLAI